MLTREEVEEVIQIEGKVRTVALQVDGTFVTRRRGKEALSELEDKMQSLGYPIKYQKMRAMGWCPLGVRVLSLLAIKDMFNWSDEEVRAMGYSAPAYSLVAKLFMKALASPKLAFSRAPDYWTTHYDVGELEMDFDERGRHINISIKEFKGHPILCKYLEGYLERAIQIVLARQKVSCVETKCVFRGDSYHKYYLSW